MEDRPQHIDVAQQKYVHVLTAKLYKFSNKTLKFMLFFSVSDIYTK